MSHSLPALAGAASATALLAVFMGVSACNGDMDHAYSVSGATSGVASRTDEGTHAGDGLPSAPASHAAKRAPRSVPVVLAGSARASRFPVDDTRILCVELHSGRAVVRVVRLSTGVAGDATTRDLRAAGWPSAVLDTHACPADGPIMRAPVSKRTRNTDQIDSSH